MESMAYPIISQFLQAQTKGEHGQKKNINLPHIRYNLQQM